MDLYILFLFHIGRILFYAGLIFTALLMLMILIKIFSRLRK